MKKLFVVCMVFMAFQAFAQQKNLNITILDATVKDKTVSGVEIIFQKPGQTSVKVVTGTDGKINIPAPFGVDDATVSLITRKDGYASMVVTCPCDDFVYAISPAMQELDGMRVVLTWGAEPEDLDLHLAFNNDHIYFHDKQGTDAHLDVDDRDGYGPETITVLKKHHGAKYLFGVRDYMAYDNKNFNSSDLSNISNAKVFIYIGSSLIKTYTVPGGQSGSLWVPFYIDEEGNIVDVNRFSLEGGSTKEAMEKLIRNVSNIAATTDNIKSSSQRNALGEKAYHAKDYEEAVAYYREAIELDPNNGQAYSNLGLVYQRMGNMAEAIWANRKAIDLAHGASKNTIQASSYYNIARIYEGQGKFEEALQHYEWALEKRNHNAYTEGIKRMEEKLFN